jgi:hypothetical protein
MSEMTVVESLCHEIAAAEEGMRPVGHVRVSRDVIPGSPVCVPVTPERARTIALRAVKDGVIADPSVWMRQLEIVVHPQDWMEYLRDMDTRWMSESRLDVDTFRGIPVSREGQS